MDISDTIYPKRKENPKVIWGKILWLVERCAHNTRHFILRNKTIIDLSFIIIYLIEQLGFLYILLSPKFDYDSRTVASVFIIVLLSTMAIEKALMELRFLTMSKGVSKLSQENSSMKTIVKDALNFVNEITKKRLKKG